METQYNKFILSIIVTLHYKSIIYILGVLILSVASFALISSIQTKLFLQQKYIMWIFKYPASILVFIYEFYIIIGLQFILKKDFNWRIKLKDSFIKNYRKTFLSIFVILNIVLMYTIIFDVTVITKNGIIDYTFLSPQGNQYSYNDIIKINTGVYGKKLHLPFAHYLTGDFYYIIQLRDGTKINLTDEGEVTETDDVYSYDQDNRFIVEKLDRQYVDMGISKVSSMDNFEYCTENLDKIYTDKLRDILLNTK